ncbi:hypothetical protein GGI35DRAFT_288295 [Trichoderma velutinum]
MSSSRRSSDNTRIIVLLSGAVKYTCSRNLLYLYSESHFRLCLESHSPVATSYQANLQLRSVIYSPATVIFPPSSFFSFLFFWVLSVHYPFHGNYSFSTLQSQSIRSTISLFLSLAPAATYHTPLLAQHHGPREQNLLGAATSPDPLAIAIPNSILPSPPPKTKLSNAILRSMPTDVATTKPGVWAARHGIAPVRHDGCTSKLAKQAGSGSPQTVACIGLYLLIAIVCIAMKRSKAIKKDVKVCILTKRKS